MSDYLDSLGEELHVDDYVRFRTWRDELFQVKGLQYPREAIIRNVIPGGRLGTSTMPCRDLTRAINNPPEVAPAWFETTYEDPDFSPFPSTLLPCGCHLRRVDMEAVLCPQHVIEVNG
jgi:hypothetical protein